MITLNNVLPVSFYARDPVVVARELLGKRIVHDSDGGITAGCIVETEAYLAANDPASHAFRGKTARNASMFGPPGHAYVYTIHTHCCINVVSERENVPSAVLIRAVEPLQGIQVMKRRRRTECLKDLTNGPGKLCKAFAIDRSLDGLDVTQATQLWCEVYQEVSDLEIAVTPRIGVSAGHDMPLRFVVASSPFVSRRPRG